MKPVFMSEAHVELMNERLAASSATLEACGRMPSDVLIAYRLRDEDTEAVVWWQMRFSRTAGVRFLLGEPSAVPDVTFEGGYWSMVEGAMAQRRGEAVRPDVEMKGDAGALQLISEAFGLAQGVATVPVEMPKRGGLRS
jgi:hypothetical protein